MFGTFSNGVDSKTRTVSSTNKKRVGFWCLEVFWGTRAYPSRIPLLLTNISLSCCPFPEYTVVVKISRNQETLLLTLLRE
jgi:hypothetical protein